MNRILESTKYVVDNSEYVRIHEKAIEELSKQFSNVKMVHWLKESPLDFQTLSDIQRLHFILVFNSISFSYWGNPKWTVTYENKTVDGSWAMVTALNRAVQEGFQILDPKYLSAISEDDFAHILRGSTTIPLFQERLEIIRNVGRIITEKYQGNFGNMVLEAKQDIQSLLGSIIENFKGFKDVSEYKGKEIFFYKRAQVLTSDINQMFDGKSFGKFTNADQLTAAADYKLPQALRRFGVLYYSDDLANKIDSRIPLEYGSPEEVEIRANTIWAVEYTTQKVRESGIQINSMDINDYLWLFTQTKYEDDRPYHLTRTTAY